MNDWKRLFPVAKATSLTKKDFLEFRADEIIDNAMAPPEFVPPRTTSQTPSNEPSQVLPTVRRKRGRPRNSSGNSSASQSSNSGMNTPKRRQNRRKRVLIVQSDSSEASNDEASQKLSQLTIDES